MAALRDRLSAAHGAVFAVAGSDVAAFPTTAQLLAVKEFVGLPAATSDRLHGVARAALDGQLDTETLRAMELVEVMAQLQQLDGIGPFYAELITIRALGRTDVAPTAEPKVLGIAGKLLGDGSPLTPAQFESSAGLDAVANLGVGGHACRRAAGYRRSLYELGRGCLPNTSAAAR
jgi:DNA-3-methyladenine glycosylase II